MNGHKVFLRQRAVEAEASRLLEKFARPFGFQWPEGQVAFKPERLGGYDMITAYATGVPGYCVLVPKQYTGREIARAMCKALRHRGMMQPLVIVHEVYRGAAA